MKDIHTIKENFLECISYAKKSDCPQARAYWINSAGYWRLNATLRRGYITTNEFNARLYYYL